ncbi:MAG TPA: hypothetical protein GX516_01955 [Thermoanaerobacter sp.]|nr:hypothetical protein [Thermoanaerobacter sp.]
MKIFELMDRKRTVKVFVGGNGHIAFEKSKKEIDAELVLEKLTSDDSKQSLEVQILKFLRNKHTNEKNFLKKIKNKDENTYKVTAGKQGRGFEVYPAPAVVSKKEGKWEIKWLNEGK